ncbi:TPA: spermidine acetyltransferase, partial [Clostridioides difficile]|nr:spermidine acetyltransferase [Clostridioides difficile]
NEYNCDELYLSIFEDNKMAIKLYKDFGFEFNGELDYGGEKVMVLKSN